jgi:hypothetical protein
LLLNRNRKNLVILIPTTILFLSLIMYHPSNFSLALPTNFETGKVNFNFAALGDWACVNDTINTVKNIVNKKPQFVLGLGDYSYEEKADCWLNIVRPIDKILRISLGNHELDSFPKLYEFIHHFNLSKPFYSFDFSNVHFIAMSTEFSSESDNGTDGLVGSQQYIFVTKDLSTAASNPNIHWIIVYFHKPAYASPNRHTPFVAFRDTYHPLFQKYHVDLVLQGHNHLYERSYPIAYNDKVSSNPLIIYHNNSSSMTIPGTTNITNYRYDEPKGQIFATVGTGGATQNVPKGKSNYIAVQYNGFGFLDVNITNSGTKLNAVFYANDGSVRDEFSIIKPYKDNSKP